MYNRGYIMNLNIPIYFECANEADVTIQLNGSVHIQNCKYEYSFDMNEWYEYKEKAQKQLAIEWCEENGFSYE